MNRAKIERLKPITEEEWIECSEFNRSICEEFLTNSTELSPHTLKIYRSNLRIWFNWVRENLDNKKHTEIKSREYLFYQNWLVNRNASSSDVSNKRAAISSLNNYIVLYYEDIYPTFRNFINKGIKKPEKSFVRTKEPLTKEEFSNLIEKLKEMNEWQKVSYLLFSYSSGCRRSEAWQLKKDLISTKPVVKTIKAKDEDGTEIEKESRYYITPPVRCKGKGKTGNMRRLKFDQDTMDAFIKWIEQRGEDDCEHMFVSGKGEGAKHLNVNTFNAWCSGLFTRIVGRRVHPHITRESRATNIVVEEGKDIKAAQALLGHKSSETTEIYVIKDDTDEVDDLFAE